MMMSLGSFAAMATGFGYPMDQGLANDLSMASNNPLASMAANPLTADYAGAIGRVGQVLRDVTATPLPLSALSSKNNGTLDTFKAQGFTIVDDRKNSPTYNQPIIGFDAMGNPQFANMPQAVGGYNFGQSPIQNFGQNVGQNFGQVPNTMGGVPQTFTANTLQNNGGGTNGNLAAFGLPGGTDLNALGLGDLSGLLGNIAQGAQNATATPYTTTAAPNGLVNPAYRDYRDPNQYSPYGTPMVQYDYSSLLAASSAADTTAYSAYTNARRSTAPASSSSWDAPTTTRTRRDTPQASGIDSRSLEALLPSLIQALIPMLTQIVTQAMGPVSSNTNYLNNTRYVQPEPTYRGLGPTDGQLNALRNLGNLGGR